jgi:hypothetical protein
MKSVSIWLTLALLIGYTARALWYGYIAILTTIIFILIYPFKRYKRKCGH